MTFSEHLQELRLGRGISQKALAKELHIAPRAYQYYEHGEREPQLSTLVKLADFYDLSLDELVGRER